jgi:transcriptional regulator with XRE-family HTH domain
MLRRLRELRLDRALSQRDLAINVDVTQTMIVKAEAGGDARPSMQRKLAEALGVQPRELIGAEPSA